MSCISPVLWQPFRLGLYVSPIRRAAFSISRRATNIESNETFKALEGINGAKSGFQGTRHDLQSRNRPIWTSTTRPSPHCFRKQIRWISLWKSPPNESVPEELTTDNELSLSPEEINEIFGSETDPEEGTNILITLQKHRENGTLDYELKFSNDQIAKGLAYLRSVNSVDEDAAIIARIDREVHRLPQTDIQLSPHAVSQFERLKKANEERFKEEKDARKAEDELNEAEKKEETARRPKSIKAKDQQTTAVSKELERLQRAPEWVKRYREEATNQDPSVQHIPRIKRLLPSTAVVVAVLTLSVLFAQNYTPPSRNIRLWPDIPPAAATMITIIGINFLVYTLWGVPPLWKFMNRSFLVVPIYPYAISMIGAAFSQQTIKHLIPNVIALWILGTCGQYYCHSFQLHVKLMALLSP